MDGNGQMDFGFNGWREKSGGNGEEGKKRKKAGMESVAANNRRWMNGATLLLHLSLPRGWRGLPEDWRPLVVKVLGEPTRHQAWGPLTLAVIRDGMLTRTGKRVAMRSKKSHARVTDEYERR